MRLAYSFQPSSQETPRGLLLLHAERTGARERNEKKDRYTSFDKKIVSRRK